MATIPIASRGRVVMDLIKDGTVNSLAAYQDVDQIDAATALKYARAFWDAYPHPELFEEDGTTPREPTNDELGTFYLNRLRSYHKEILESVRVKEASNTAGESERTTVTAETQTDLSGDE